MLETAQAHGNTENFSTVQLRLLWERNRQISLGKYLHEGRVPAEEIIDNEVQKISQSMKEPGTASRILSGQITGQIQGIALARRASWDSEHFGIEVGKISTAIFDSQISVQERADVLGVLLVESGFDLTSARINLADLPTIHALEKLESVLTDVLLTLSCDTTRPLAHSTSDSPGLTIEPAETSDLDQLAEIARVVFTADRFHADPRLDRTKSDQVYSEWVANSLRGLVDAFFVARDHNTVAGFITCKLEKITKNRRVGIIDLVAVSEKYFGKNVGFSLVQAAVRWFQSRAESVYVGTQAANSRATRLYEKSQFRHVCSEATYHVWRGQ